LEVYDSTENSVAAASSVRAAAARDLEGGQIMMKHLLRMAAVVAVILSIVSCSASGPGTSVATISSGPASENADQTIMRLEHDWVTAIVKKDTGTLDRLLADDFSGTTDNQIYSKTDAIEDVKAGTHESLELDNIKVRLFGDTAVVTMGQTEKSRHGDSDFSGHYLFTDVWAKRNGQWIAVASHGSRIR
jgi:ketosteroid isomerase-like protein